MGEDCVPGHVVNVEVTGAARLCRAASGLAEMLYRYRGYSSGARHDSGACSTCPSNSHPPLGRGTSLLIAFSSRRALAFALKRARSHARRHQRAVSLPWL
jgi:hypothetical protein